MKLEMIHGTHLRVQFEVADLPPLERLQLLKAVLGSFWLITDLPAAVLGEVLTAAEKAARRQA